MTNEKRKEKKKKDKERQTKDRVLRRREAIREQARLEKKQAKLEHKFRDRIAPIVNAKEPETKEEKEERVQKQLEHNVKILEALEDEYLKDQDVRKEINEELEAEGHSTFKEKMDAMEEKAIAKQPKKKGFAFGGSAKVTMTPREESDELSKNND